MQFGWMVRALSLAAASTIFLGLSACGGGGGGGGGGGIPFVPPVTAPPTGAPVAPPTTTSRVVADTIVSTRTGAAYSLEIYLPASYDGSSASYPVIYALDGDAVFNPPGNRFANLKDILDQRNTQAILVGIGGTARRTTDYVLPGAVPYHDFLTSELVPFIEAKYRSDTKKRMLTGLSLSGSMTGIALFLEGAKNNLTFSYFLSFEGTYDGQGTRYQDLEQAMHDGLAGNPLPATLFLTRCATVSSCNFNPVDGMYQRLLARGYPGFTVTETTYSTTHGKTDIPSFTDAIAKILP